MKYEISPLGVAAVQEWLESIGKGEPMKECAYCDGLGYVNKDGSPLNPPVEEEYEAIKCPKCSGKGER